MKKQEALAGACVALTALLLTACAHQGVKTGDKSNIANGPDHTVLASTNEPDVRDDALRVIPEVKNVYFDYNSAHLEADARAILKTNAQWLKAHEGLRIEVTGNCDQRGTAEYNLALGQRRAAAVRSYYALLGVPKGSIATISYGKEKPVCQESNESCWQRNRRAETLEAVSKNISSNTPFVP